MEVVIELSSDDEQPARSRNTRKEQRAPPADGPQEVILDSDHEDCGGDIHGDGSSGSANDGRLGSTSQEKQSSIDVVDLYAASSSAVACGICAKEPPAFPFTLAVCRHRFCHECISRHVNGKLTEALGHEVGCPECSSQLTMNELHVLTNSASLGPDATRPSKKARGSAVGTLAATKRLMRELQAIERGDPNDRGFAVSLSDESDLYTWDIEFFNFEGGSPLAKDLSKVPGNKILLRAAFPSSFPASPPYIRVIRPRFVFRTGHVTIGGSICTEMLSSQGWTPTMTMESVLLSIRSNMLIGGARIDLRFRHGPDYSELEAREAFNRMMREHGWF